MQLYPLLFEPNLHPVVWGGNQLRPYKGLEPSDEPIGESWEVSAMPTSTSIVSNGVYAGKDLTTVINEHPDAILGKKVNEKYHGKLPLLVKFIDAKRDLSIQVHPNDEMAMRKHGKMGKSEMWYVIKSDAGAHLYAGFNQEITPYEYQKRVEDGTITNVLADHKVKAGDVFYLPAGRVHAICGGILLAEVQQSSDVTYRIFDYNRPGMDGKPRELHTELAAKALDYHVIDNYRTEYVDSSNKAVQIIDSPFFSVRVMEVSKPFHRDLRKYDSFIITMCIEGDCKIRVRSTGEEILLKQGNSTLIPDAINPHQIKLEWEEEDSDRYLDGYSFSDGTIRFIALAALLLSEKRPDVILIDEPELGLHPAAITKLAAMIRRASQKSQIIVSTQSAAFIDEFDGEDIIVAERNDEGSAFHRLDAIKLDSWRDNYSLGELWRKNVLGGRP